MPTTTIQRFELKPEHLALLRSARVRWNDGEFGAPTVDPKRPYGNSSVIRDVARILQTAGLLSDAVPTSEESFDPELYRRLNRLHEDTEQALQVVLTTGQMQPGLYEASAHGADWRRVGG